MCVENQRVGYYESAEDFLADPDFTAWQERTGRRPTNSWPAYLQALADARELIELSPSDVAALAGQNHTVVVGGGDLTATGARMEAA